MQHTMIAVFDNRSDAQNAMNELLSAGFDRASVRMNEDSGSMSDTSAATTESSGEEHEGFGASIKHFFSDLFGDAANKPHMQKYQTAIERGHHALTVTSTTDDEVERAADIIERFNPIDIDESAAHWGGGPGSGTGTYVSGTMSGGQNFQGGASMQSESPSRSGDESNPAGNLQGSSYAGSQQRDAGTVSNPVMQEKMNVGKREVERGDARDLSRTGATPVEENITLREEHVNVERRPVDQPLVAENAQEFKEQSIKLRETNEEAVDQKTSRIVDEVVFSKDGTQRQESTNDPLRHTEVELEQPGTNDTHDDSAYRSHWASNYGTTGKAYENFAPAYSFGSDMATNYHGRQWDDVEDDVRSHWESRNADHTSTWEEFKDAIRRGWDNITH